MLPIHSLKRDVKCLICHCAMVQKEMNTEIMTGYGEQQNVHHSYWDGERLYVSSNIFPSCICSFLSLPPLLFLSSVCLGFFSSFFFFPSLASFYFFLTCWVFFLPIFIHLIFSCNLMSWGTGLLFLNSSTVKRVFSRSTSWCFYGLPSFSRR